ncbi:MAG: hypothetical protein HXY45_14210 [Syntrophaceae bacterium]|nr:hypothetical protein [Syntrophaceae bacterium]
MIKLAGGFRKKVSALKDTRSPILWASLAVIFSVLVCLLVFRDGGKTQKPGQIPAEVLSKIDQEKAQARQEFADFIQTPAGKLWQRYPYWSPEMCRKIAAGEIVPGMSKEQAREAVSRVVEVKTEKGKDRAEEWVVESRNQGRMLLKFDGNALVEIEKK